MKSGEVSSIDPQDNIDNALKADSKLSELDKKEKRKKFKEELKTRLNNKIKLGGNYKKTDDFKKKLKELQINKMTITRDKVSFKILPFANAGRPVMVNNETHSMVAYGYNSTSGLPIVRLNMGWGKDFSIDGTDKVTYKYSNIDYNMGSIFYLGANKTPISSIVTFKIAN